MKNTTAFKIVLNTLQRGQAMVEFAVIILVLTLIVVGGIELATAVFWSSKTNDAAKQAAMAWVAMSGNVQNGIGPIDVATGHGQYGLGGSDVYNDPATSEDFNYYGLGDHQDPANFTRATCTGAGDYGLGEQYPARIADKNDDDGDGKVDPIYHITGDVYLFNPKPLDITDCDTAGNLTLDDFVKGLPKVNQAIYPLYERHVVKNGELGCTQAQCILLMLPGRLDADDTVKLVDLSIGTPYIDVDGKKKAPASATAIPAIKLECANAGTEDFNNLCGTPDDDGKCWLGGSRQACEIKIEVRYKFVFESFVTMFMGNSTDASIEQLVVDDPSLFDNADAGNDGNIGKDIKAFGSELKPQKRFLGCHQSIGGSLANDLNRTGTWSCN